MTEKQDAEMMDAEEDSSDSDSDFEEVEVSEEDMGAISTLESELEINPNLYDKHVEYIALLRRCKMKARVKDARQAMYARFPLAEPLWLEWLDDEIEAATSPAGVSEVERLFQQAVQDYLSINIWAKYLQYLADSDSEVSSGSAAGKTKMREACESALAAGGIHLSEGSKLWKVYRAYEAKHAGEGDAKDPESPIMKLFYRQLQVPLLDGAQTVKDLAAHLGVEKPATVLPDAVKAGQAKAQKAAQARGALEASVSGERPADTELLANFMAYISYEEASGEPARAQCLYERALARFPVTHVLWLQYAQYLEQHLSSVPGLVGGVYARGVRNCPWVGALWARALRALERSGASDAEQEALYNSALAAGMESPEDYMEVCLARLDALRRKGKEHVDALRAAFQSVTELMQTYFPDYVDRSLRVPAYWATCELEMAGDHDFAREVWEAALRSPLNMYAESVLAYVALEVSAKRFREARSIFRKFHRRQMQEGGELTVCQAWLRFEREHGSAQDHLEAVVKTAPVLAQAAADAAAASSPQMAEETKKAAFKAPKPSKAELKKMRQEKDPNFKGKAAKKGAQPEPGAGKEGGKRKTGLGFREEEAGQGKRQKTAAAGSTDASPSAAPDFRSSGAQDLTAEVPQPTAGPVAATAGPQEATAGATTTNKTNMGPPPPKQPKAKEPAAAHSTEQQGASEQAEAAGKPETGPSSKATQQVEPYQRKAYIKGIAPGAGVADLEALLGKCGEVVDLSVPEDRTAQPPRHRGFAYVTFATSEGLQKALALDGTQLQGHALSVAVAHLEVAAGEQTAFLLNVAEGVDSAALEALLAPCGPIKSMRIPLDRDSSKPRGFAYVEFETSQGLQRAVDMTGVEIGGKNLKITVSHQPIGGGGRGGGGRGGGRDARGRGRGPPGRGRGGGRGRDSRGGGRMEAQRGGRAGRQGLDLQGGGNVAFRPRSVPPGGGKSNADFRALLK